MKKKWLYCVIIGIFLLPAILWSSGQTETGMIVPKEAVALLHIDMEQTLHTKSTLKLMELYSLFQGKRNKRDSPEQAIDKELTETLGITLKKIKTITLFTFSMDMSAEQALSGMEMVCEPGTAEKAVVYITNTYGPTVTKYKKVSYLRLDINNRELFIHISGDSLFFSSRAEVMKKMIDVLNKGPSIKDNQYLYKLVQQFKDNPFYAVCYIPEKGHPPLPSPFDTVRQFGLTITPGEDLSFTFTSWLENPSEAEQFIASVKGAVALFGMAVMAQDRKAYPVLQAMIQGLTYEQKGKQAVISGKFTGKELKNIIEQVPSLLRLMQ